MAETRDELLRRAFELAFFILRDRAAALRVAAGALEKLDVAAASQDKRLYYTPAGRATRDGARPGSRTKVSLGDLHLLQRLVYVESEPEERGREAGSVDEDDMVVHFVKHLARVSVKRSSFYVALAFCRLLHTYSTAEAMDVYAALVQDPDRVPDDYYCRSRKRRLMAEVRDRFGDAVRVAKGQRGEERFESDGGAARHASLVEACLRAFSPWRTACRVPEGFDATRDAVSALAYCGADPDGEHEVEVARIHAAIHPECFGRLAGGLGLADPAGCREVPRFWLASGSAGGPGGDRTRPPSLDESEAAAVARALDDRARRRRAGAAGLLRISVDGREAARLDPSVSASVRLEIDGAAELVEVKGRDRTGEAVLLAALLVPRDASGDGVEACSRSVTLEGGQRVTFGLAPAGEDALLDVEYRETAPLRAAALAARRAIARARGGDVVAARSRAGAAAAAAAALALAAAVSLAYVALRGDGDEQPLVARTQQPSEQAPPAESPAVIPGEHTAPTHDATAAPLSPSNRAAQAGATNRQQGRRPVRVPALPPTGLDPVRATGAVPARIALSAVRTVYVDPLGGSGDAALAREALARDLAAGGRFALAPSRDGADAVLKGTASAGGLALRLVGASGEVLWSGRAAGGAERAAAAAVASLAAAAGAR